MVIQKNELMATYSVAEAKTHLPRLIDEAMAGEEVIISRRGRPVAELRRAADGAKLKRTMTFDELYAGRIKPLTDAPSSVELLDLIYDDPDG